MTHEECAFGSFVTQALAREISTNCVKGVRLGVWSRPVSGEIRPRSAEFQFYRLKFHLLAWLLSSSKDRRRDYETGKRDRAISIIRGHSWRVGLRDPRACIHVSSPIICVEAGYSVVYSLVVFSTSDAVSAGTADSNGPSGSSPHRAMVGHCSTCLGNYFAVCHLDVSHSYFLVGTLAARHLHYSRDRGHVVATVSQ